ncbi:helix-turn-helix domain-containing protein [Streptococcus dysgalactiae]|uniref:helix-turn-helix domain-containing protein n=1 Tax=Streptococcus dysgalactiae TaxID=1334 RepID=UPI0019510A96|nr:XRE family transcriptional regulator [Streptococcus dysgalactiae]MBM6548627.1 helix-turn-helix domain-containing protein [Streptococcus dysgalactiae subsp. equisimilis]
MLEHFGEKVRGLRLEKGISREELCGDEAELSVRQLARIELGQSIPSLAKVIFIAKALEVSVGYLTDGANLELPKRYKELKYLILRTPTYMDDRKLQVRESQFDEIFENYYDQLPEEEKIAIDIIQAKFEVYQTGDINFGFNILKEFLPQLKKKTVYNLNELLLIDLYLIILVVSNFTNDLFDEEYYKEITERILEQHQYLLLEDLFLLNNILLSCADTSIRLKMFERLKDTLQLSHFIMSTIQDFQRMPMYCMYEWKLSIFYLKDIKRAETYFSQSLTFTQMTNDSYLAQKLQKEWDKDIHPS